MTKISWLSQRQRKHSVHNTRGKNILSNLTSRGLSLTALLAISASFYIIQPQELNAALAISDSGLSSSGGGVASSNGSSSGGGAQASNTGVALVGDGDCSLFSGDTTYSGVYGNDSTTYIGGMYGFGSQTTAVTYSGATNAGSNAGFVSYQSSDQTFGNVTYLSYANRANNKSQAYGLNSFSVGCNSSALGVASTSLGLNTQAYGTASIAMGIDSIANAGGTIAMGMYARAMDTDSIALGALSYASVRNAIAIGSNAQATGIGATALGSTANGSTSAGVLASGAGGVAIGGNSTAGAQALGSDSIAIGGQSVAGSSSNNKAIAIGVGSQATGASTIAIGVGNIVIGTSSGAIGDPTTINGSGSYSLGNDNTIDGDNAGTFGNNNDITTNGTGGRIVGNNGSVSVADGFILGNSASVTASGGVAIGSSSIASVAAGGVGFDPFANAASTATGGTFVATNGAISIGSGTSITRQLNGVAAGSADTDAVNIAQLKLLRNYAAQGWNLTAAGTNSTNVGVGGSIDLSAGSSGNLSVSKGAANNNVTFELAQTISLTSVTTGNTQLSTNGLAITVGSSTTRLTGSGLSIAGGPSISTTGINGAGLSATNFAEGVLSTTSSDAVTGKQLNATNTNISTYLGGSANIGQGTAPSYTIQNASKNNVGDAFSAVDSALTTNKTNIAANSSAITALQTNALQWNATLSAFDASYDSAGTGSKTAQKISNLADGALSASSSDAVTGRQLYTLSSNLSTYLGGSANIGQGTAPSYSIQNVSKNNVGDAFSAVDSALTTNKANIATNSSAITTLQTNALQWNATLSAFDASYDSSGTGSKTVQKLTNVANGTNTYDAVNFGQLTSAVNASAWNLSVGGTNSIKIGNGATVDFNSGNDNLSISKTATGTNLTFSLADDLTLDSVTTGNSKLTTSGLAISSGSSTTSLTATGLSIAGGPVINTTGINAAGLRATNLADGVLSTNSSDAVTGRQLNATNSDLSSFSTNVNSYLGGDADVTTQTAPTYTIQNKSYRNVGAAFDGVDASLTDIQAQITSVSGDALQWDSTLNAFNAGRDDGNGGVTASKIVNVNAGAISQTSTEAINGAQLFATNTSITTLTNDISDILGGGADLVNGEKPSFEISVITANSTMSRAAPLVSTYNNVGDALTQIDTNVNTVNTKVDNLSTSMAELSDNALMWNDTLGAYSAARTTDGTTSNSKITDIADGLLEEGSSDAVTGGQVYSSLNQIAEYFGGGAGFTNGSWVDPSFLISAIDASGKVTSKTYGNVGDAFGAVNGSMENVNARVDDVQYQLDNLEPDSFSLHYDEDLGGYNAGVVNSQPNKILNVADGTIAQGSKDVVNGGQLWDTNQRIDSIESNVSSVANNAVSYDKDENGNKTNSISLIGADASKPVTINNVADGKIESSSTQAVNGGQLYDYTNEQMQVTLNDAKAYTDQRIDSIAQSSLEQANYYTDTKFNQLNGTLHDVRKEARQAAAIGLAASSLRFDATPGKLSVAAGGGFWKNEGAFAVGAGYTSETGKVRANITATSAGGDFGVGGGISLTLN